MALCKIIEYQIDPFTGELKRAGVVPATPNENQLSKTLDYRRGQGCIVSAVRIRKDTAPGQDVMIP